MQSRSVCVFEGGGRAIRREREGRERRELKEMNGRRWAAELSDGTSTAAGGTGRDIPRLRMHLWLKICSKSGIPSVQQ